MGALKDFFSFKWLTGSTSNSSSPARTQNAGGVSAQGGTSQQVSTGGSIFSGKSSPNKGFPTLVWAFFYLTFFIMVGVAIIGWRADLFSKGIAIIATLFALILAFMYGLVVIFGNYVAVLGLWKIIETTFEMVKGGDVSPVKLKAIVIGTLLIIGMTILVGAGVGMTYNTAFNQDNRITLMFNQTMSQDEISKYQQASVGGGLLSNKNRHVVKQGDTLAKIAGSYNVDVNKLIQHNKLKTITITPGQIINIP